MITNIPLLDQVRVAKPCPANWDSMEPVAGDRVRFCFECAKNVYNLSEMTREEAEDLIRAQEGRLCVRYYRRTDGTILTQDCPVGVRNARRMFLMKSGSVVALLALWCDLVVKPTHTTGDMDSRSFMGKPMAVAPPVAGGISVALPPKSKLECTKDKVDTPEALLGEVSPESFRKLSKAEHRMHSNGER